MANARYTNLPNKDILVTSDVIQSAEDKTRTFFNGYFDQKITITGNEWDVVFTFFQEYTGNDDAAYALSEAIITSSRNFDVNSLDLIKQLRGLDNTLEVDQVIAIFLNETRDITSLIGYTETLLPNKYVSRNILA